MLDRGVAGGHSTARRFLVLLAIAVCPIAVGVPSARAELTAKGDLFVRFDGGITPTDLPRHEPAPISVRIEGQIRTPAGQQPPDLQQIEIALNSAGKLDARGLPACNRSRIDSASPAEAIAVCGPALVGSGGIVARTVFSDQPSQLLRGNILLFNAIVKGRSAILAHVHQSKPTPATYIVVFAIRRTAGTFGTVVTGQLPPSLNRNGYLQSIFLQLGRTYSFHGPRSYLSASCAAPAGFPGSTFPFARTSMAFEDGRVLSATLTRSCRVRG